MRMADFLRQKNFTCCERTLSVRLEPFRIELYHELNIAFDRNGIMLRKPVNACFKIIRLTAEPIWPREGGAINPTFKLFDFSAFFSQFDFVAFFHAIGRNVYTSTIDLKMTVTDKLPSSGY